MMKKNSHAFVQPTICCLHVSVMPCIWIQLAQMRQVREACHEGDDCSMRSSLCLQKYDNPEANNSHAHMRHAFCCMQFRFAYQLQPAQLS